MSYILEALRRSQAERERGHVPGLHAQPVAADASHDDARRTVPAGWALWLAGGTGLLVLVALLVWWTRPAPVLVVATPGAVVAAAPPNNGPAVAPMRPAPAVATGMDATPAPAPAAAPTTAPTTAATATPTPTPSPAPSLPIVVSAPPAVGTQAGPSVPATREAAAALAPRTSQSAVPANAPGNAAPPGSARALTVAELSPEQRRELPQLVLGGSVWSDNVASRFVIFNGQIIHEGQPAAQGVMVERIGPKAAQLRWRGLLLEVPL